MGSKNRNRRKSGFFDANYWQSANFNQRAYAKNLSFLLSLAVNRFKWEGLPDTCDVRFLEMQLHRNGIATMCHEKNLPEIWQTLIPSPNGDFDVYGYPVKWEATGYNQTHYSVTPENGELCYYSFTRANPWNALEIFARKLTHYERTEDINLSHQHKPWILAAPPEQRQQLVNLYKQIDGGEPAILGTNGEFLKITEQIQTIDTGVPLITEDLARSKLNVLNDALLYLGIPHLAFEKGERMIEDEARANTAPTNIMLLDCLQARRDFCRKMKRFGFDLHVYFNEDLESMNYNYVGNVEALAQDNVLETVESGADDVE